MPDETRLFYLRTANRTPIGAVAFTLKTCPEEMERVLDKVAVVEGYSNEERAQIKAAQVGLPEGLGVRFSATICHPDDQFVKKQGRTKTIGRLNSFDKSVFAAASDDTGEPPPINIQDIMKMLKLPLRKEIDYGHMNQLLFQQLRAAYQRAGVTLKPTGVPTEIDATPATKETVH